MSRETPFDWDRLLESVVRGHVIPVVGPELLVIQNLGSETLLQRYLAERLAEMLQLSDLQRPQEDPLQFLSGGYLDRGSDREDIAFRLHETMKETEFPSHEPLIDDDGEPEKSS